MSNDDPGLRRARRALDKAQRARNRGQSVAGRVEQARVRAARSKRARVLGLDTIVDVALRIVDREGVDAVSMRRVAAEFDTGPASLYAYVANKDELLRLVLARVIDAVELPAETDDWQQVVREWAHNARAELVRHNDIARLTFAHVPAGEEMLDGAEPVLDAMVRGGVPAGMATWAMDITSLYVAADAYKGWLLRQQLADDSGPDPEEVGHERFHFAIDTLIAGFAARARPGPTSG